MHQHILLYHNCEPRPNGGARPPGIRGKYDTTAPGASVPANAMEYTLSRYRTLGRHAAPRADPSNPVGDDELPLTLTDVFVFIEAMDGAGSGVFQ